ncbi:MAG: 50S ribosomal protein L7/L12 [Candidatus Liberibacter ctenarytainae]|uniref:Large ribosomal subunit protein bL12 n=1 Tax=Candidatus Liberibacter ctenarytainae TaxID=2020335 RepID=A0A2D0XNN6_9HYPH|nr:50S ribosomal subunit protein L12 [Candidatus Liberibacter ctenarytainae]MBL0849104.1 50S ribosomal protein L7/L12 [Candidatus Liberibacter ctenarytainae]
MSNIQSIVDQLSSLTLIQAAELAKKLEETWGVSAAAPVAVSQAAAEATSAPVSEKTEFDVVLVGFDAKSKIALIKEVRSHTTLGLKEAKDLVEGCPKSVKEGISKSEAEEVKKKLDDAGGIVEIR